MEKQILIEQLIALADVYINQQVNKILHHPQFQALESAWRGLALLTKLIKSEKKNKRVEIRFLQLTQQELAKDLLSGLELDRSQLFQKIYTEELDQAGGQPFGVLIGDYYFSHKPNQGVRDGVDVLQQMAKIAANSFVPFVSSVSPHFFGLDSFSELQSPIRIEEIFVSPEYHRWQRLRQDENAHFLALTLPRILMREPYNSNGIKIKHRFFKETLRCHEDYLWGNAAYVYGAGIIQCFLDTGWFMNLRGQSTEQNTLNSLLPRHYFENDSLKNLAKISTECLVTDRNEKILSESGFIAARDHAYSQKIIFYSSQSVKLSKSSKNNLQASSAKINTLLHYVLCMSRFAHYIKVIIRDKVGSFTTVETCENFITKWLNQYCSSGKGQSMESLSKKPLASFKLSIQEIQGSPGKFFCAMVISPHSQFDDIQSQLRMVTQIRLN
jgi:type VI secretion system protein ImpD